MEQNQMKASDMILHVGNALKKGFNLNDAVRMAKYRFAFYNLSGNEELRKMGGDPDKSLLVIGDIGVGKTMMMRVMQVLFKDTKRRFKWVEAKDIKDLMEGEEGLGTKEIKELFGYGYKGDLLLDDIGVGQVNFKSYGNVTNIIGEIILDRYRLFIEQGYRTHFTSNIPPKYADKIENDAKPTLLKLYGDRVLDRLVEMTNLTIWEGKSLRRENI